MAVQMRFGGLTRQEQAYRRQLWLLFLRAVRSHARLKNRFKSSSLLHGRGAWPDDPGFRPNLQGKPWGLAELRTEGRTEARERGIANPTPQQVMTFGLYCAARRAPLIIDDVRQIAGLVRCALFDPPEAAGLRVERLVTEKLRDTLQRYVEKTDADFIDCLFGEKNNLIRILAQHRRRDEGALDRCQVQHVLLDLGWQAYAWVARCLGVMLALFMELLPERLEPPERQLFTEMYLPRPYLGGLSPLLLLEREVVFRPALEDVRVDPTDRNRWGVLHRLMHLAAEMTISHRQADNEAKDRAARRTTRGLPARQVSLETLRGAGAVEEPGAPDLLADPEGSGSAPKFAGAILEEFRRRRGITCPCASPDWVGRPSVINNTTRVRLSYDCLSCGKVARTYATIPELREIAETITG
jgi:hypothetical protein